MRPPHGGQTLTSSRVISLPEARSPLCRCTNLRPWYKAGVGRNPQVEAWFKELEHPRKKEMLEVRKTSLATDPRIEETIKWKSPTFMFEGNIASIEPRSKKQVSVLFHQGADSPGNHPLFEGGGGTVRYMRFGGATEVEKGREGLQAAVKAWIELKS